VLEFDFSCAGFTGQIAAKYVSHNYKDLRWAIAGRSASKLSDVQKRLDFSVPIVVADSSDVAAIDALVGRTKVVVTFAGPFARYGSTIVKACSEAGTDYCDITGEIDWVRQMIEKHDDTARRTGARIVHLCGHDSMPWDLMTMMLAKKLKERGDCITRVDMFDDIKSAPSGGTLETAFGILFGSERKQPKSSLSYDPLYKSVDMESDCKTVSKNVTVPELSADNKPHRGLFVMADVNAKTVRRSNALNKYSKTLTYCEGQSFASFPKLILTNLALACFGGLITIGPVRKLLLKLGMIPSPGEGPSEKQMLDGHLTVTGMARGEKGEQATAELTFPVDPGYMDTARMAIEAGLTLALEGDRVPRQGGVLTPASCQGEVLLERLIKTGSSFSYKEAV